MPDEFAYARKASGLVRGMSMVDAFAVGFMNQGLTPSIWVSISLGLGVYLGGNLILATIISAVLTVIGFPLVWGILGGSMPRSGGEYVYNSRIVHPIFGIAQSFGDAAIWLLWIYVLAPLAITPGLTVTFDYLGWTAASDWVASSDWVAFLFASIVNLVGFLFVVFGIKIFALTQKVIMLFGIGGCAIICLVLTFASRDTFVSKWNATAAATDSYDYNTFIAKVGEAAGTAIPTSWNWVDTIGVMVAMSWLFAYAYSISFIAGEVKRPDKTIIWANVFSVLVPFVFMLWVAVALHYMVGDQFLRAAAWNDNNGPIDGYAMPYSSSFIDLAVYVIGTEGFWATSAAALMGISFFVFSLWWVALSYLAFPRILFAWGMDRMGPKWFTDINPRFASPIKNHLLCLVLSELLLIVYYAWLTEKMQNITLTGMQITSVFLPTAIAALLFPYMRRSRGIWETSPYKSWRFLGLPVVVWGAIVSFVYLLPLLYYFIFQEAVAQFTNESLITFVAVWLLGIAWYFIWKYVNKTKSGVDIAVTYGELPPE